MAYTLSRHAFALSLLHAAVFHCYQEKRDKVYKAECVFGLTLILEWDYEAEAYVQMCITFYESATDWQKNAYIQITCMHACAPWCAVINTISSEAWASTLDSRRTNSIAPYFSSSTLTIAQFELYDKLCYRQVLELDNILSQIFSTILKSGIFKKRKWFFEGSWWCTFELSKKDPH